MNDSESVGVGAIELVQVAFPSNVDTSDMLSRFSPSCFIIITSSSVTSTILNYSWPLSEFTKSAFFPISDAVQSLFAIVLNRVGYSGTSTS